MLSLAVAIGKVVVGSGATLVGLGAMKAYTLRVPAKPNDEEDFATWGTKFVKLPDGRKLEYRVAGPADGIPVYFQHGYGGSCLGGTCLGGKTILEENGVKMIAASMPGFGLSDSYPLGRIRKLAEWPADVSAVLDQENIKKCHILGISAGCVHAAVLAKGLPEERVGNVLFCCPTAPDSEPGMTEGMSKMTLTLKKNMGRPYIGDLIAWSLSQLSSVQRFAPFPDCKAALQRGEVELPEDTQATIDEWDHGLRFTYRGLIDNAGTIQEPLDWLPELGNLVKKGHAIAITSAPDDTTNPPIMQRWFQQQIPGSVVMDIEPGWGHLHPMVPENKRRICTFLKTGKDPKQSQL